MGQTRHSTSVIAIQISLAPSLHVSSTYPNFNVAVDKYDSVSRNRTFGSIFLSR